MFSLVPAGCLARMGCVRLAISGSVLSRWPCVSGTKSTTWSVSSVLPVRSTFVWATATCSSIQTLFANRTFLSGQRSTAICRGMRLRPLHSASLPLCHKLCQYWKRGNYMCHSWIPAATHLGNFIYDLSVGWQKCFTSTQSTWHKALKACIDECKKGDVLILAIMFKLFV